jgi:hypothetical protein
MPSYEKVISRSQPLEDRGFPGHAEPVSPALLYPGLRCVEPLFPLHPGTGEALDGCIDTGEQHKGDTDRVQQAVNFRVAKAMVHQATHQQDDHKLDDDEHKRIVGSGHWEKVRGQPEKRGDKEAESPQHHQAQHPGREGTYGISPLGEALPQVAQIFVHPASNQLGKVNGCLRLAMTRHLES